MDRAERRRQARAATKLALRDTGFPERAELGTRPLPEKVPGRHRWILLTTYSVPDSLLEEVAADVEHSEVYFDHENRLDVHLGCYDCEQPLSKALVHSSCPGEPPERT